MYSHPYDGHDNTKLTFGIISQHGRYIWEDIDIKWQERDVWDAENVLYLDLCDGYMSINGWKTHQARHSGFCSMLHIIING